MFDLSVYYMYLQYFDIVGWVFWPVKTVSNITYTVFGGDIKHCSVQSNPSLSHSRVFVMIVVTDSELNRPKKIIVSAKVQATFGTFCSFSPNLRSERIKRTCKHLNA